MDEKRVSSGGIGLTGGVFLVFLVLKLTGHIDWSWWAVTAPLWIGFAIFAGLALAFIGFCFILDSISFLWRRP